MRFRIQISIALLGLITLFTGCSQEPAVEKEVLAPVTQPAPKAPQAEDQGLVGSSHQQEAAMEQAQKLAAESAREAAGEMASAPSEPMEVPEGYRATHVSAQGGTPSIDLAIPEAWEERTPASSMRLLQLALPGEGGAEAEAEAELTVFYFGPSAGSIQMNIDRWIGQFTQPDGSDSNDKATIVEESGDHHQYTIVDVAGTMAASSMMGAPETPERPGWRMLASIVSTPAGPWFLKATGPEATLGKWREEFVKVNRMAR
jgi:hypothetical protein